VAKTISQVTIILLWYPIFNHQYLANIYPILWYPIFQYLANIYPHLKPIIVIQ
jgi:hypothetical protein